MSKVVMIVEDELFLAEMIRVRLEVNGYEIHHAESGREALEKLESLQPDMILMDYMMPEMDGVEATKRIKANERFRSIPIIFMTAMSRNEERDSAMSSGGDDYLVKPFETEDLLSIVEKWTARKAEVA